MSKCQVDLLHKAYMNADNLMSSSNGILNWFVSLFLDYLKKSRLDQDLNLSLSKMLDTLLYYS